MLRPINVPGPLPLPLPAPALPEPTDLEKLFALEAVQQDAAEALVEVVADAGDDLVEDVGVGGARAALRQLGGVVGGQDGVGGRAGWERHQLQVFRHVLPVVDEERFEVVGDVEPDGGAGGEGFFLLVGGVSGCGGEVGGSIVGSEVVGVEGERGGV